MGSTMATNVCVIGLGNHMVLSESLAANTGYPQWGVARGVAGAWSLTQGSVGAWILATPGATGQGAKQSEAGAIVGDFFQD